MSDTKAFLPPRNTGSYSVSTSSLATLSFPGALITTVATVATVTAIRNGEGRGGGGGATPRVRGVDNFCLSSGTTGPVNC